MYPCVSLILLNHFNLKFTVCRLAHNGYLNYQDVLNEHIIKYLNEAFVGIFF